MSSRERFIFWLVCLVSWIYIITRAVLSPFVFDEATTFLLYVHNNAVLPGQGFWSANNHVLNSALTWIAYNLLGPEEWQLRLPNLLAFPVFCFFVFRLAGLLKQRSSRTFFVLAVFTSHLYLEMFAYSRGYGLSFAALAGLLYFSLEALKNPTSKNYWGLYLSNAFILIANLTLLPIALVNAFVLIVVALKRGATFKSVVTSGVALAIPIVYAVFMSFQLKAKGELYYAADNGFWSGSVGSLLEAFWTDSHTLNTLLFVLLFVALLFFALRKFKNNGTAVFLLLAVSGTPLLFYPLAKVVLHVEYPLDRALLYWPLLIFVALAFAADGRTDKFKNSVLVLLLFGLVFVNLGKLLYVDRANAFKWHTEQISDTFYNEVLENEGTVGGYFLRQKCWEYLNIKSAVKANVLQISGFPDAVADYQIINAYDLEMFKDQYLVLQKDKASELLLLQRKPKLKKTNLLKSERLQSIENTSEFIDLCQLELDTISEPLSILFTGELISDARPFRGLLAISVLDSNGQQLSFQAIRLRNLYEDYNEGQTLNQEMYFSNTDQAQKLKVFVWNKYHQPFIWQNVEVKINSLAP